MFYYKNIFYTCAFFFLVLRYEFQHCWSHLLRIMMTLVLQQCQSTTTVNLILIISRHLLSAILRTIKFSVCGSMSNCVIVNYAVVTDYNVLVLKDFIFYSGPNHCLCNVLFVNDTSSVHLLPSKDFPYFDILAIINTLRK